ncbi:LPS translocon maturation chaperone LptM [Geminicoccus harenae]|uniref:LPS translocon maturation chaperone LptM n=1 Tax=Geminicoccus harenae TaxID=2498453 RepID=UPI00168B1713|nr:hypothetical protein [Geminicoccus harenae]
MRVLLLFAALALPLALGACGKKGALEIPPEPSPAEAPGQTEAPGQAGSPGRTQPGAGG